MTYLWNAKKSRENAARHGVAFEDAVKIFDGPTLEQIDDRFDYGELRIYAIGLVNGVEVTDDLYRESRRRAPDHLSLESRAT